MAQRRVRTGKPGTIDVFAGHHGGTSYPLLHPCSCQWQPVTVAVSNVGVAMQLATCLGRSECQSWPTPAPDPWRHLCSCACVRQFEYDQTGDTTQLFIFGGLICYLVPATLSRMAKEGS